MVFKEDPGVASGVAMAGKVLGCPAVQTPSSQSISSQNTSSSSITAKIRNEKVIAAGNGITVSIALTEPVLYLPGFDHNDPSTSRTAMLRGGLRLKVTKPAKIKRISLSFRGILQTEWPEGITSERFLPVNKIANTISRSRVKTEPAAGNELYHEPYMALFQCPVP
jgi:hypothetical protein